MRQVSAISHTPRLLSKASGVRPQISINTPGQRGARTEKEERNIRHFLHPMPEVSSAPIVTMWGHRPQVCRRINFAACSRVAQDEV